MDGSASMTAKEKRIKARLEQIKQRAAEAAAREDKVEAGLAEEAAGLGLDLLEEKK